jgi:hypothetical protein
VQQSSDGSRAARWTRDAGAKAEQLGLLSWKRRQACLIAPDQGSKAAILGGAVAGSWRG